MIDPAGDEMSIRGQLKYYDPLITTENFELLENQTQIVKKLQLQAGGERHRHRPEQSPL